MDVLQKLYIKTFVLFHLAQMSKGCTPTLYQASLES